MTQSKSAPASPHEQGKRAYWSGKPLTSNPHPANSVDHHAWAAGHKAGKQQDRAS